MGNDAMMGNDATMGNGTQRWAMAGNDGRQRPTTRADRRRWVTMGENVVRLKLDEHRWFVDC